MYFKSISLKLQLLNYSGRRNLILHKMHSISSYLIVSAYLSKFMKQLWFDSHSVLQLIRYIPINMTNYIDMRIQYNETTRLFVNRDIGQT